MTPAHSTHEGVSSCWERVRLFFSKKRAQTLCNLSMAWAWNALWAPRLSLSGFQKGNNAPNWSLCMWTFTIYFKISKKHQKFLIIFVAVTDILIEHSTKFSSFLPHRVMNVKAELRIWNYSALWIFQRLQSTCITQKLIFLFVLENIKAFFNSCEFIHRLSQEKFFRGREWLSQGLLKASYSRHWSSVCLFLVTTIFTQGRV